MTYYPKGKRLHVEMDITVTSEGETVYDNKAGKLGRQFTQEVTDPAGCIHYLYLDGDITVTETEPDYWPPKPGEVWESQEGTRYVVRESRIEYGSIFLEKARTDDRGKPTYSTRLLDEFKALDPRRVFPGADQ